MAFFSLDPEHRGGRARARLLLFGAGVLFGLSAILAKLAARGGMDGGQVTLCRFTVGLGLVAAIFVGRPGTFRPVKKGLLVTRGLFGGFAALLYFLAIERISAGEATLINNTFPIWATLASIFVLDERPTLHLAFGLLLASAGVFLVVGGPELHLSLGVGQGIAVLSAICGGVAVTSIRALRATDNAPTIFFAFAVGGLVTSLPYGLHAWPASGPAWLAAGGVGIVAFGAQLCMTEAYGALSVPEAALWQQLTPIASFAWGLLIGERLTGFTVLGVTLGVAGIVWGSVLGFRPRARADARRAALAAGLPAEEP
ncbi:MAG: DMT family transporter [Anaeromyxobacteraceae bacterium]